MTKLKLFVATCALVILTYQAKANDSLKLAESYINLSLTEKYFDSLQPNRIEKILNFEETELASLKDPDFIQQNSGLYYFTYALLHFNKASLHYRTRKEINRSVLRKWNYTLDKAIDFFNRAQIINYDIYRVDKNEYYEQINFNNKVCRSLDYSIYKLKNNFKTYFNNDIYKDFQRIFHQSKLTSKTDFDSLKYYASIYNISLDLSIIQKTSVTEESKNYSTISKSNSLSSELSLISQYLQLNYLANELPISESKQIDLKELYKSYNSFVRTLQPKDSIDKDDFFRKELGTKTCNILYKSLQKKFPYHLQETKNYNMLMSHAAPPPSNQKYLYFFPNPAPLPSALGYIYHFKPALNTLKEVNNHLIGLFTKSGYASHLHYYYCSDGFAVTTSIEKFEKNEKPLSDDKRWNTHLEGDGSFSYYEIFKSIFFEVKSEYRMFAMIVASKNISTTGDSQSIGTMQEMIKKSYDSLPKEIENKTLADKTLTMLVYHFHQNDIGEVPMLDISKKISVNDHLKNATLQDLLLK